MAPTCLYRSRRDCRRRLGSPRSEKRFASIRSANAQRLPKFEGNAYTEEVRVHKGSAREGGSEEQKRTSFATRLRYNEVRGSRVQETTGRSIGSKTLDAGHERLSATARQPVQRKTLFASIRSANAQRLPKFEGNAYTEEVRVHKGSAREGGSEEQKRANSATRLRYKAVLEVRGSRVQETAGRSMGSKTRDAGHVEIVGDGSAARSEKRFSPPSGAQTRNDSQNSRETLTPRRSGYTREAPEREDRRNRSGQASLRGCGTRRCWKFAVRACKKRRDAALGAKRSMQVT